MSQLPRRLRSFSLRTLMVLVAAVCVLAAWLSSERKLVLARLAALEKWETVDRSVDAHSAARATGKKPDGSDWPRVSWVRCLLGDVPVAFIQVRRFNEARLERIRRLFPEAEIITGFGYSMGTRETWERMQASSNEEPLPVP